MTYLTILVATKYCYSLLRVPRGKKVEKPCSRATTKVFLINCNLRLRFAQVQRQPGKNNLIKIHKRTILFSRNTISKDINCAFFIFCVISTKKMFGRKKLYESEKMNLAWMQTKDICWTISSNKQSLNPERLFRIEVLESSGCVEYELLTFC